MIIESANTQALRDAIVIANFCLTIMLPEILDTFVVDILVKGGASTEKSHDER